MATRKPLGQLCTITTGAPISRIKKIRENDKPVQVKVLLPGAMQNGNVVESELALETVANAKEEFFSCEGDVIVKASTPYGCVYIDKDNVGLLTTSFSLILRPHFNNEIDMCYLSLFLNSPHSLHEMELMSTGASIRLVKKKDLARMLIPIPAMDDQKRLARLYEQAQEIKKLCRAFEERSGVLLASELSKTILDA